MHGFTMDLHVHTNYGSLDSVLSPTRLIERAPEAGLHGVAITEHNRAWTPRLAERVQNQAGIFAGACREIDSDMGHLLVLGLAGPVHYNGHDAAVQATIEALTATPGQATLVSAREVQRVARDAGAALVVAHPFRYFGSPRSLLFGDRPAAAEMPAAQLAEHPVFSLVDEIEVLNGDCTEEENCLALAVATVLGKQGTGGSDAHTAHELGRCVTVFERRVGSMAELADAIRHGRFAVARRVWQPSVRVEEYHPWRGAD